MVRFFKSLGTCFILISLLAMAPSHLVEANDDAPIIRLATLEYAPLVSQKLENQGLLADLARHLFRRMGYKVDIQFSPFKRGYEEAKKGKIDGILALWYRPFREEFFVYGPALHYSHYMIVKRKGGDISVDTPLSALRLGVTRGSSPPQHILDAVAYLETSTDELTNLRKVYRARIDAAYVEKHQLEHLERTTLKDIAGSFEPIAHDNLVDPLHIALSKNGRFAHLAERLKNEFAAFILTPDFQNLLTKHQIKRDFKFSLKTEN